MKREKFLKESLKAGLDVQALPQAQTERVGNGQQKIFNKQV